MLDFADAARAYVRQALLESGLTPTALAKKAGISSSTLTRSLNNPKHRFALSMRTLEKIHRATGINPAPFLESKDVADLSTSYLHRTDVYDENIWGEAYNIPASGITLIVGEIAAGHWIAPTVIPLNEYLPLRLIPSSREPREAFGVYVADKSAEPYASKGETLFCLRPDNSKWGPRRRELVVVQERHPQDFKVELSARLLTKTGDNEFLLRRLDSNNAIIIKDLENEPTITILGYVDYVVRHPGPMLD